MTYGYLRVSTEKQDEVNQKLGVDNCAKKKELKIDKYVIDHAKSGTIPYKKRNLGQLEIRKYVKEIENNKAFWKNELLEKYGVKK